MAGVKRIPADVIRRQLEAVFRTWGMAEDRIATTV